MSIIISIFASIIAVLIHYEFLNFLNKTSIKHRFSLVFIVLFILLAHIIEVSVFALIFYIMAENNIGGISGITTDIISDSFYLAITTFSTVGYGEVYPVGGIRIVAGVLAVLGFVLITWSASFLYYQMQNFWNKID